MKDFFKSQISSIVENGNTEEFCKLVGVDYVSLDTTGNSLHSLLSVYYFALGEGEVLLAEKVIDRMMEISPNYSTLYLEKGKIQRLKSNYELAEACIRHALKLETDEVCENCFIFKTELGKVLYQQTRFDECLNICLSDWSHVLEENIVSGHILLERSILIARTFRQIGRFSESISYYRYGLRISRLAKLLMQNYSDTLEELIEVMKLNTQP